MKLRRADMHLRFLYDSIQEFLETHPYDVEAELDFDTGEVVMYGKVVRDPSRAETTRWGVVIGDIVHNLRSALDHMIWVLSLDASTPPPPPPDPIPNSSPWHSVAFPVIVNLADWTLSEMKKIAGVRPDLRARIEALQPFNTGPSTPREEPLAVLHQLWQVDKHRHLHLTNCFVGVKDIVHRKPFPSAPDIAFQVTWKRDVGPFKDGAPIARAKPIPIPGGVIAVSLPMMHMEPHLAFDVAFDQGPPAYGGRVMESLERLYNTVSAILIDFQPEVG
jgi:hypothetical protein